MIMEAGGDSAAAAPHRATPAASGGTDAPPGTLQSPHSPEEEDVQERRPKAGERAGWEDAIALMARDAAVLPGPSADSSLRSCTSTASMKVKNVKKLALSKNHFPRLAECAHFHYENVDFGSVQLNLTEDQNDPVHSSLNSKELVYLIQITCQGKKWTVRRSYEDFRVLDKHLHLCIYDRRFSQLAELPRLESFRDPAETLSQMLTAYLSRLSSIADNKINCGPTLTWMEIDNKGNHLLVHDESFINVPAVAAAHVTKRYIAQAADELSFEVGDIVSVIDMPPKEDSGWWRGKHGFQVGFFPSECVEIISEKVTPNVTNTSAKPVSGKHGKLITFLRTYVKSRPTKQKLKQRGILRERVFGCDLGEHLLNSGSDVPQVIKSCTEFIEKHGIVDGIYRLSGISSNIQKLRHEFDSEHIPELTKDTYVQDIHCVGSLCKLYFRELPNPLLTYQLYDKFSDAVSAATDDERLVKIHDVIQQLPPPHYRTLEFLMRHLARMAAFSYVTNMHSKNLAIVWAPNLLRSRQIESACFGGTSAFMEVRIQSVVVEFILNHVDVLFSSRLSTLIRESTGHNTLARPKSLLVCSPSTKLLSLEEAQARTQAQLASPVSPGSKYIEVGEGPAALQGKFHTVIELPLDRKKAQPKVKKSPVASWRSFFSMAKSTTSKRKMRQHVSVPSGIKTMALPGGRGDNATLRSAKSEESLSSNLEGASVQVYQSRRPRSTSDAISTSFHEDLLKPRVQRESRKAQAGSTTCVPALISSPQSTDGHFGTDGGSDCDPALSRDGDGRKPSTNEKCRGSSIELGGPTGASRENASERHLTSDKLMTGTKEPDSSVTPPAGCTQDPEVDPKGQSGRDDDQHRRPSSLLSLDAESPDKSSDDQASTLKQTESGAVTFDCTPGLVRSVSLITSQPAVKSAARMLALALAESAQQATSQRKRGSSEPPTPVSPLHLQDPLSALLWPSPLPSQPPGSTTSEEICEASGKPAGTASAGTHADLGGSPQSTCACHGSESGLSVTGSPESALPAHPPVRENVRHVGVGTDNGSPGGTSEVENRSALAALLSKQAANESNFRVILAEASVPASVHDVPQAPASPPAYHPCGHEENTGRSSGYIFLSQACHYQPDYVHHQPPILTRDLYGTLAPRTIHQSIKHKGPRRHDYLAGCSYRHGGPRYPPMDGASVYPTIRRVRSMHAPPDDSFFFSPQSSNPHATFQRPLPSRFRQVRPYFADGRVQYRFKPCSGARHDPDHYPTSGPGYNRPYSLHRMPGHPGRVESHHNPSGNLPFGTEGGSANRNVSPVLRMKPDRLSDRTVRQRTVGKPHDPTLPPRPQKASQRWKEPTHIRNKSDSFRDLLISTEGADGKYRVTMVTHHSPEHPPPEPERPGYAPAGPAPTLKQSRSMQNYTQAPPPHLTLHKEYSCPDFKHSEYPKEDHQRSRVRDVDPQRSERSHSMKNQQQPRPVKMTLDHEHRLSYPAQIRQRTRSMFAPSRTMYTDSHGAVQPKGPTVYPNYGCMAPHRSRLYTTDIGTGSFLRSKLRAKTEVYAE